MKVRTDGSFQSANTPTFANVGRYDSCLYRCMVSKVFYVDDPQNVTKNSQNPEVTYEVIILGGSQSGQKLNNCRLSTECGGIDNFNETILTSTSKPITNTRLSDQDGDVVFVLFIDGHSGFPQIIATGKGITNQSGTKKADGPRKFTQYNGVSQLINNSGEFIIGRNGGSLDSATGRFNPGTTSDAELSFKKNQVLAKTLGSAELNLKEGTVALGASGIEILQQITDVLQKIITFMNDVDSQHSHFGNLGYLVTIPTTSSDFTQLGTDLTEIQNKINSIKGSL